MIIDGKLCCNLYGEMEKTLSKLNRLKDTKISLIMDYNQYCREYREEKINVMEFYNKCQELLTNMRNVEEEIYKYEQLKNKAVEQRVKNNDNKSKSYFNRKIDGININIFRSLTKELYNEILPKVCYRCGSTYKLHIHHLRYKHPIEIKDLVRLCASCHSRFHKGKVTLTPIEPMEVQND
jgi:hypothetical protein